MDAVRLTLVANEVAAEVLCGSLRANGIECAYRRIGPAAGIDALSGGFAVDGASEVLVHERDLEAARRLLPDDD
jgi:hypothetical protein